MDNLVKLGEIASIKTGKLDSNAAKENGRYPFFTCGQETLRTDTYSFDTKAVLLAGNNAQGIFPIKYHEGKFDVYQRTYVIESLNEDELLTRYLFYVLSLELEYFRNVSTGVTTKFLTLSILNDLRIKVPPIAVQNRIVDVLSGFDDLSKVNRRRIETLQEITSNLYCEWFVHFRYPGHKNEEIIQTPCGPTPKGWKHTTIGNAFTTVLGGTPSREKKEYWKEGTIPWVNSSKINELRVMTPTEYITELGLQQSSTKLMPKRTTLIAITGATLGQVSLSEIEACANQSVVGIFDPSGKYSEWIYLEIFNRIQEIIQKASGGAQQHINKHIVDETRISLPPIELIIKFTEMIKPIFDLISNLLRINLLLREIREIMLPNLVSGEIDVNQVNIGYPSD